MMTLRNRKNADRLARLLALGFGVLLLVLVELAARLVDGGDDELERILDVLERDPVLFWRQRPHLSTTFAGHVVTTDARGLRVAEDDEVSGNKEKKPFRIVCLGASPTFGWGVDYADTYSHQLEKRLGTIEGRHVRVVNGGMIGYSSHQGRRFFEREILPQPPDLITISYVINDVDSYRFFRSDGRSDRILESENAWVIWIRNLLDKSAFYRLLGRLFAKISGGERLDGKPLELYRPGSERVPIRHYWENLEVMNILAKREGISVVLIAMPVNLPVGEVPDKPTLKTARSYLEQGARFAEEGHCEDALPEFEKALEHVPDLSLAHYYRGVCLVKLGRRDEARQALQRTVESESKRCGRMGLEYNEFLRAFSRENKTPLVDVAAAFAEEPEYLFVDPDTDPIHPNEKGHRIIADLLAERIAEMVDAP